MIKIKKPETATADNSTKLMITASEDIFMPPKVEPKKLKSNEQAVQPEKVQIIGPLFQIH